LHSYWRHGEGTKAKAGIKRNKEEESRMKIRKKLFPVEFQWAYSSRRTNVHKETTGYTPQVSQKNVA
jgi:hypothetical protein